MDDEYLFKIALDATDFNAGVQAMRSLLGEIQDAIGGNVRAYTQMDTAITKFESSVAGAAAASGKMAAETRSMAEGFSALLTQLKEASDAYKTFREEQVVGNGVSNPHADVWAMSAAEMQRYLEIDKAANASIIGGIHARMSAEASLTKELAGQDQARIDAKQRELAEFQAIDRAIAESEVARINAAAAALTAEVQARKKAALESTTILAGQAAPYTGLASSAQRRTVGNAYTVQPSDGTGSEADLAASQSALGKMREYYSGLQEETAQRGKDAQAAREQTTAFKDEAAARDRTTAALNRSATGLQRTSTELPRLRYALYDISTTFTILGAGLAAYGGGIAKVTSGYQTSFASVARTSKNLSQDQLGQLKSDLIGLSTQIPATFDDITKIATLGNQLNIPSQSLTGFTKTVTEFATAANVSTDVAATAFGRLGQIFKTQDYQALGDQIAYLGVRAVATEADIIKVSQQIAVSANAYGISEKNTLALATAYASLGVRAESARGTTVRMLADLQKAVVQGGAPLAQIADVTGMSGAAFAKLFSSDANAGMTVFLQGLARYGRDSKNVLAELGITAQRDITNIGLLSQNTNVLTDAQKNATQAGGALQAMFDKQTNTISAQLTLAGNKAQSILNDIGSSAGGPLRAAVDSLNALLDVLDKISKDPIAATTLAISAAVITLSGVALIGIGTMAQYAASILAVRTYMEAMGGQGNSLRGIFQAVTGTTVGGAKANLDYAESLRAAASASQLELVNARALTDSRRALVVETEQATVVQAEQNLELAKSAGVREGIIASEIALAKAQADLNLALAQQGVLEAEAALKMAQYGATLDEVTFATARLEVATLKLAGAQDAVAVASRTSALAQEEGALTGIAASADKAATSGSKLAGVLGKAGMVGAVLALLPLIPVLIDGIRQAGDAADGTAADVDTLTSKILGLHNKTTGAQNLADLKTALQAGNSNNPLSNIGNSFYAPFGNSFLGDNGHQFNAAQGAVNQLTGGQSTPGTSISYGNGSMLFDKNVASAISGYQKFDQALSTTIEKGDLADAKTALAAFNKEMADAGVKSSDAQKILTQTASALGATAGQSLDAALASKQSAAAAGKQAQAFSTIVSAAFASSSATSLLQKDMGELGKSFEENGAAATIGGGALQKVIEQIYADTGGGRAAAAEMQGLFDTLVKGSFASVAQLKPLSDIIARLTGGAKIAGTQVDGLTQFYEAWNKSAEAANKSAAATQAASRTLMDYGSDVNKVIGDMLTYQFGVGDAQDKLTQGWDQMKSDLTSSRDSMKSIRTDILAILATKATAQFALSVDTAYGDVTAAAQDRATLAKANADIAAKNKDLKTAQDASSASLTGNSEAAIKNRQALEGQIGSYQAYIVALAQSGASQATIDAAIVKSKQQFVEHATQLGFNRAAVDKLATAFDGMRTIINQIPRNITTGVTAKTSAAMKALADYRASIKQTNGMSVSTPIYPVPKNPGVAIGKSIMDGLRQTLGSQGAFDFVFQTPAGKKIKEGSLVLSANRDPQSFSGGGGAFTSGPGYAGASYAGGGWTGNGGIYDPAGIVHGQEFVLNAIGAKILPMADLIAMNQGRAPHATQQTVVIGGSGKSGGFTAQDKMFLAQVLSAKPAISLSADQFGKAVDGANVRANMRGAG